MCSTKTIVHKRSHYLHKFLQSVCSPKASKLKKNTCILYFLGFAVRSMVLETERLVESRRLLEAHARLMDLECWQDDILWQLHGATGTTGGALSAEDQELVTKYFSGVGQLVEALGKESLKIQ